MQEASVHSCAEQLVKHLNGYVSAILLFIVCIRSIEMPPGGSNIMIMVVVSLEAVFVEAIGTVTIRPAARQQVVLASR